MKNDVSKREELRIRAVDFTDGFLRENGVRLDPMFAEDAVGISEFIGQIIDIIEDFLDEKGVRIENPERFDDPGYSEDDDAVNIYGSDYGDLQDRLTALLKAWGLAE